MTPFSDTKNKQAGCLILAGGQGTRLGIDGPKGCVTLPIKEKKTLFQILLEKVKDVKASIAIMTSPLNHEATLLYLKKNDFFGLENVTLFQQEMEGGYPNGNGKAFALLHALGIYDDWKKKGIESVQVLPVDNPLATPFDAELLRANEDVDLALRVVEVKNPDEKIGRVVGGRILKVHEYIDTDIPPKAKWGNTGIFSCKMDFIYRIYSLKTPTHEVKKKINNEWVSKKEYFIFDLFPYAKTFQLILSKRSLHFSPLKNASGSESFTTVMKDLAQLKGLLLNQTL